MSPILIASIVTTRPNNNLMHFRSDHCGVALINHECSVYSDSVVKDYILIYIYIYIKKLRDTLTQLLLHNSFTTYQHWQKVR